MFLIKEISCWDIVYQEGLQKSECIRRKMLLEKRGEREDNKHHMNNLLVWQI